MSEHRRQVLQMLAAGEITADDAERLLSALEPGRPTAGRAPAADDGPEARPRAQPRYLRVLVESSDKFGGEGPGKVNIRVPIQLLRAGVKLASLVPPRALEEANKALEKQGVPFDLTQIKPQHIEELVAQLDELVIELDQPDVKVQVFSE